MSDQLDRNKQTAMASYDLMFSQGKPAEAVRKYVGDVYIQHNPDVADGKEAFSQFFERMAKEHPRKRVHVKRAVAEGQYVVLHCHQEWPGDEDWAGMDIFRFDERGNAPHLLDVEVAGVLRRYQLSGELSAEDGREALADLAGLDIARYPHDPQLPRVWELRTSVTAYDAVYLALADSRGAVAHAGPAAGPRQRSWRPG